MTHKTWAGSCTLLAPKKPLDAGPTWLVRDRWMRLADALQEPNTHRERPRSVADARREKAWPHHEQFEASMTAGIGFLEPTLSRVNAGQL